jgi:hypothetical protein
MEQRTHAWIAIRAVALLEEKNEVPDLLEMLKPQVPAAAIGAWLPDKTATRHAHGRIENHIFKMEPLPPRHEQAARFTTTRQQLTARLGATRRVSQFLQQDTSLPDQWWQAPYKADAPPGQHIPNCVNGMRLTVADLLAMGNLQLQKLTHRAPKELKDMAPAALTEAEQAAVYFMMISHFIADASMPCHCDKRPLAKYGNGLHEKLEEHWASRLDALFDQAKLLQTTKTPDALLDSARKADRSLGLKFPDPVPGFAKGRDAWLEMVDVCRGSFALSSIIAPPDRCPYGQEKLMPFADAFRGADGRDLLARVDQTVLHDAVLNTAMVWKDTWLDASGR